MVKKNFLGITLLCFNILWLALVLFYGCRKYKYPVFVLNTRVLLFVTVSLVIFDLINIFVSLMLKRSNAFIRIVVALLIFVVSFYLIIGPFGMWTFGHFWKSEVNDFDEFCGTDEFLQIKIAGLTLDDITSLDIRSVDDFHYYSNFIIFHDSFEFKGRFVFSEEDYNTLKGKFVSAPEFNTRIYSQSESSINGMTGSFDWIDGVPLWESETTVDNWEKSIIEFCDDDHSFYFDLVGVDYT